MSYTHPIIDKQDLPFLNTLVMTFAIVGLLGLIPLSSMLIKYRNDLRNPAGRIVIALAFCNGIDGIFKLIGRAGINAGLNSALCVAQGFMLQQLLLTQWFLGAVLAYYTARMVLWKYSINSFKRKEGWILGLCFFIPLPISFYCVYGYPNGQERLIGNADLFCWISTEFYPDFQMYLAYAPIMAIGLLELIVFVSIVIKGSKKSALKVLSRKLPYKRYLLQRYFAYMMFFLIGWIFAILNRLVTVSTRSSVVALLASQAISNTMLGMLHCLAFAYSWRFHPLYCGSGQSETLEEFPPGPALDFEPDNDSDVTFESALETIPTENATSESHKDRQPLGSSKEASSASLSRKGMIDTREADTIYYDARDRSLKEDSAKLSTIFIL